MEIIIGKTAGFCFGVKNAVTKATEELKEAKDVYCLGELVHNKQVTEVLEQSGMRFIDNIEEARNKVIIRSHGATKQTYEQAKNKNIELKDLTCPKVLRIHNIVKEYANKQYYIFLIGNKKHPEMIGTASFCGRSYSIVEKEEDIESAIEEYKNTDKDKAIILSQTTYSLKKFNIISKKIMEKIGSKQVEIKNTICNATKERQDETEKLAKQVDAMIIVGGKHSSNSNKLYELASKYCKKVIFIETKEEINLEDIKSEKTVAIMAGASTPQKSIEEVVEKLKEI